MFVGRNVIKISDKQTFMMKILVHTRYNENDEKNDILGNLGPQLVV